MTLTRNFLAPAPAALTAEHLAAYKSNGFLAFDNFLTPAEVEGLNQAIHDMAASLYRRARAGELQVTRNNWDNMRNYSGLRISDPQSQYAIYLEPDVPFDPQTHTLEDLERAFRKINFPSRGSSAFADLVRLPRLLAALEALVGPGPILFSDQALCKPARIGSAKPWHQDAAYFCYAPFGHGVDVWIALDDASTDNGCMYAIPGAHTLGPKLHRHEPDDCTVAQDRYDYAQAVPIELAAGGIMIFSPLLPHFTPPNHSDQGRRAVQLFYRAAHTKPVSGKEHAAQFTEADGTPATCSANSDG